MNKSGKTIPKASRVAVRNRALGRCERCGGPGAQWHHRRGRSVVDEHRHEACNGIWLCPTDHAWAHANPKQAMEEGFIVSRANPNPATVPVLTIWGERYLTCDGRYSDAGPRPTGETDGSQ